MVCRHRGGQGRCNLAGTWARFLARRCLIAEITMPENQKMPVDISVQIDRNFEDIFYISILSKKFRILRYVWENPGCDIKNARSQSGLSSRGFQIKLKELIEGGFLSLEENASDGRRKQMAIGHRGHEAREYLLALRSPDRHAASPTPEAEFLPKVVNPER